MNENTEALDPKKVETLSKLLDALPPDVEAERDPSVPEHWWARAKSETIEGRERLVYRRQVFMTLEAPISKLADELSDLCDAPEGWRLVGLLPVPRRPNKTTGHASGAALLCRIEAIVLPSPSPKSEDTVPLEEENTDLQARANAWEAENTSKTE